MAFSSSNLKKIAGGATGIFYYDSTDAIGTIDDADYFLGATNELKVGDIIIAVGSTMIDNNGAIKVQITE